LKAHTNRRAELRCGGVRKEKLNLIDDMRRWATHVIQVY
jgi:hypothetical protein